MTVLTVPTLSVTSTPEGACLDVAGTTVAVDLVATRASVGPRPLAADDTRQLRSDLARAIYERCHLGWSGEGHPPLGRLLRDPDLEQRLAAVGAGRTTEVAIGAVTPTADGDAVIAEVFGVRVRLERSSLRGTEADRTAIVPATWPAISPGFTSVFGPRRPRPGALARLYVALRDPDPAPAAFATAIEVLTARASRWQVKVASTPVVYPRRDAMTIYLDAAEAAVADAVAHELGAIGEAGLGVSPFTRPLADGVAFAWEPRDPRPGRTGLSLGQHRASVLTDALFDRARHDGEADDLATHLVRANVDPDAWWRTADHPTDPPRELPGRPTRGTTRREPLAPSAEKEMTNERP